MSHIAYDKYHAYHKNVTENTFFYINTHIHATTLSFINTLRETTLSPLDVLLGVHPCVNEWWFLVVTLSKVSVN